MPPLQSIGTTLRSRYRIDKVLFETKLINIYFVNDLHMAGKSWVLREMQMVAIDSHERSRTIRKFQQEASEIAAISHPVIATVVDFFVEGSNLYIVRDYVPGNDLASLSKINQRPFTEIEVLTWSVQLAEALSFFFGKKMPAIFFREFHMGNIIDTGNAGIKLIDLGLARIFQTESDTENLSRLGSMEYASPEQFSEDAAFDIRSLVYSLGAFMYHALTNVNPSSSPFDLKPISLLNPMISKSVQDIINRATEIDPKKRYQTLNDMKRDLLQVLKSLRVETAAPAKESPTAKGALLNWLLGILLAVIIGAVLFLAYYFFVKP
ncbi:MAG: serine/threonine-protein kinase [Candidatus Eremiobacteraeota bacterium]|nr:serine/threonine-protein kinase [Candidatus Eremiobacteraeota bacterium]